MARTPPLRWTAAALAGLALAAGLPGAERRADAQEPTGASLFEQACADCHGLRAVLRPVRERPQEERRAWLDTFLTRHHARNEDERRPIVEYLLEHAAR